MTATTAKVPDPGILPISTLDALAHALCGASGFEAMLDADVPPTVNVGESGGTQLADEYDRIMASCGRQVRAIRVGSESNGEVHEVAPAVPTVQGTLRPAGEPVAFFAAKLRGASTRLSDALAVLGKRWSAGEPINHALDVAVAAEADLASVIDDMRRIRREAEYLETQGRG